VTPFLLGVPVMAGTWALVGVVFSCAALTSDLCSVLDTWVHSSTATATAAAAAAAAAEAVVPCINSTVAVEHINAAAATVNRLLEQVCSPCHNTKSQRRPKINLARYALCISPTTGSR
jgi:hypothetical protein